MDGRDLEEDEAKDEPQAAVQAQSLRRMEGLCMLDISQIQLASRFGIIVPLCVGLTL